MFANLGAPEFWQNLVLAALDAPTATGEYSLAGRTLAVADEGSYNAIAATATLQEFNFLNGVSAISWSTFFDIRSALWQQTGHAADVALLKAQTTAAFQEL